MGLRELRSLACFRPGIAYYLDALYLAPTARLPSVNTMRSCRGPSFAMRADSGFETLPADAAEPTAQVCAHSYAYFGTHARTLVSIPGAAQELAEIVDGMYAAHSDVGSMGERDAGVVFQGQVSRPPYSARARARARARAQGDPLEATTVVLDTVALVAERRNGVSTHA